MSVEDVTEILAIPLIGAIIDDEQIVVCTNQGEAVVGQETLSGHAYENICRRIIGEEVPFLNLEHGYGLFNRITSFFRKN